VVYCDNKSALDFFFEKDLKRGIYTILEADYDFLQLARAMRSSLPVEVTGTWVKGHYKGNDRKVQHDLNHQLVDFMADQFRRRPPSGFEPTSRLLSHPSQRAIVYSDRSSITSKLRQVVYRNFFSAPLQVTICKRNKWSVLQFQAVDWQAFGMAFKSFSRFRQIGVTKLTHRLWHTGAQKLLFKLDDVGLCPCCRTCVETTEHIYQCRAPQVVGFRSTKLQQFDNYLSEQEFSRTLKEISQQVFVSGLLAMRNTRLSSHQREGGSRHWNKLLLKPLLNRRNWVGRRPSMGICQFPGEKNCFLGALRAM